MAGTRPDQCLANLRTLARKRVVSTRQRKGFDFDCRGDLASLPCMSPAVACAPGLTGKSLVLNKAFLPIHVTSVRRAFSLVYRGVARAVDGEYRTFDFLSWSELSTSGFDSVGFVGGAVRIPRVILLISFDRMPRRRVRFSRHNIFVRDLDTCQYCGGRFARCDLNLDHVVPRCRGGRSTWENIVCSCVGCNRRKGGRALEETGMRLVRMPRRPEWAPFITGQAGRVGYREWRPFLNAVDTAYWNVELDSD